MAAAFDRGTVWLVDFNPTRGREQRGVRPAVIMSNSFFNNGPAQLVYVIPFTRTIRGIPTHVRVEPPEGGLREPSVAMCEAMRSVSTDRLIEHFGALSDDTMAEIEDRLAILLDLGL